MADKILTPFQKNKLMRVYDIFFDLDNDGMVTWKDIELFIEKIRLMTGWDHGDGNHVAATQAMQFVWKGLEEQGDENKDGKVSREEWCIMWATCIKNNDQRHLPEWQEKYMDFLFDLNDGSANGVIDREGFTNVLMAFGMSKGNCDSAFDTFAQQGNVDREKFKTLLIQYFYSDIREEPGNVVFGMLPNDEEMAAMAKCNYLEDSEDD